MLIALGCKFPKMNRKSPTELSQERKHGFHTITSTFDGAILKKRKVIETVDQYLTPELQDSSFGKLSEETVFLILNHLSRKWQITIIYY